MCVYHFKAFPVLLYTPLYKCLVCTTAALTVLVLANYKQLDYTLSVESPNHNAKLHR